MENQDSLRTALRPGVDAGKIIGPQAYMNYFYPKRVDFEDMYQQRQQRQAQVYVMPKAKGVRTSRYITFFQALKNQGTNQQQAKQVFVTEMLKLPFFLGCMLCLLFLMPVMLLVTDYSALNLAAALIYAFFSQILTFFQIGRELFLIDCQRLQRISILVGEIRNFCTLACSFTAFVLTFVCLWNFSHELYQFSAISKRLLVAAGFLLWIYPLSAVMDTVERHLMNATSGHVYYENVKGMGQVYKVDEYVLSCKYIRDEFDDYQEFVLQAPEPVRDYYMLMGENNEQ